MINYQSETSLRRSNSCQQSEATLTRWNGGKTSEFFKPIWKSSDAPSVWITVFKYTKTVTCFFYKIKDWTCKTNQYTFGGKFSVFGYFYPNTGINQSELAHESRDFIIHHSPLTGLLVLPTSFSAQVPCFLHRIPASGKSHKTSLDRTLKSQRMFLSWYSLLGFHGYSKNMKTFFVSTLHI